MAEWILMDVVSLSYNEHDPSCQTLIVKWYHLMTIQVLFFSACHHLCVFCPEMYVSRIYRSMDCNFDTTWRGVDFRLVGWKVSPSADLFPQVISS